MSSKLLVIGSINMDLVMQTPRFPEPGENVIAGPFALHPGGKGANQAVAAARLMGGDGEVALVGAVGDDVFGGSLVKTLEAEAVDASRVLVKEGAATGTAVIPVDLTGENMIMVALGANMEITRGDVEAVGDLIGEAEVLILQLEIPDGALVAAAELAREQGTKVILNAAPYRELPSGLLALTDTLVVNRFEAAALAGLTVDAPVRELIAGCVGLGLREVVVTLGAAGAVYFDGDEVREQAAFEVEAVDATGAGDAFVGALAVAQAEGMNAVAALRFAAGAGAVAASGAGAIPSLPTRDAVRAILEAD